MAIQGRQEVRFRCPSRVPGDGWMVEIILSQPGLLKNILSEYDLLLMFPSGLIFKGRLKVRFWGCVLKPNLCRVRLALSNQLWMCYAAQLLSGGKSSAALLVAQAYAADSTSEENRVGAMGKNGGAIGIGVFIFLSIYLYPYNRGQIIIIKPIYQQLA